MFSDELPTIILEDDAVECSIPNTELLNIDNLIPEKITIEQEDPLVCKRKNKKKDEEFKIRVGKEFQAICPPFIPVHERNLEQLKEKALTVWIPNDDNPCFDDSMLQNYVTLANTKYDYNIEQALAMLYWHKFDIRLSMIDLNKYSPFPDEWTREDKIIFEEALLHHGKNFKRIRELLPDKTVGGLIDFYYKWKKRRGRHRAKVRRGRPRAVKQEQPIKNIISLPM